MNYHKPAVVPLSKALLATAAIAATVGMLYSSPATGATVTYDFTVNVSTGDYAGRQFNGSFSYDDSTTLVSCESKGVQTVCAVPNVNNLTVQFNFLGSTYTESQDVDFRSDKPSLSEYPRVFFPLAAGTPTSDPSGGLSFLVAPVGSSLGFFILGYNFYVGDTEQSLSSLENLVGNLTYALRPVTPPEPEPGPEPSPSPSPTPPPVDHGGDDNGDDGGAVAVPEPEEIGGSVLAMGLLGLGWYWRRRQAKSKFPNL